MKEVNQAWDERSVPYDLLASSFRGMNDRSIIDLHVVYSQVGLYSIIQFTYLRDCIRLQFFRAS